MICNCGFRTNSGNKMAKHVATKGCKIAHFNKTKGDYDYNETRNRDANKDLDDNEDNGRKEAKRPKTANEVNNNPPKWTKKSDNNSKEKRREPEEKMGELIGVDEDNDDLLLSDDDDDEEVKRKTERTTVYIGGVPIEAAMEIPL